MAISTYPIKLMEGTLANNVITYALLADIKDFPDLGGAPEMLETTTLSDAAQTYINGIKSQSALEFTLNYTSALYATLLAKTGTRYFSVWFGDLGVDGKFDFVGQMTPWVVGGGVNAVVDMKIMIAPSSSVEKLPEIGALSVTSVAGATSGKTAISVTPAKGGSNVYFYKTAASVAIPMYHDICNAGTGWTSWNGSADITATTGHQIVIVEEDAYGQAKLAGRATVTSKV